MPAPCLLNSTVFVFSEKTLPSVSLPTKRISISFGIRLLRRTPSGAIRSFALRGQSKIIVLVEIYFRHELCAEMTRKQQGSKNVSPDGRTAFRSTTGSNRVKKGPQIFGFLTNSRPE